LTLIVTSQERRNQQLLFFYFGAAALALATRSPNLKHNLNVDNGTFGVLVSIGAIGSVIALMFVGQLVHRIGVRPVLIVTATMLYGIMATMPHIHSAWVYVIANLSFGVGLNGYNISVHDQALKRQLLSGEKSIPALHGAWSFGTLLSTILSIAITSHVSLAWHIDTLMAILWVGTMVSIFRMQPFLIHGSTEPKDQVPIKVKDTWAMLTTDRYIAIAYVCAVMVEFSTNDWVTLSSHQEIKASTTLSIVPYLIFMVGMTIGRLGIHKLLVKKPDTYWIRISARFGGGGFVIFLLLAKYFASHSFSIAFTCEIIGFFIGGLGGSFFAGVLTQIASQRSRFPGGVVVAQLGLAISVLTFFVKLLISWVVQTTSITYGLMIPGALMISLSFFHKLGPREPKVQIKV
jgi:MFS family permease